MIFLDTSAIYAWTDSADRNHQAAVEALQQILISGEQLITHNYVLLETITLIQARLGVAAALKLIKDSSQFEIEWIDKDIHDLGTAALGKSAKRRVSLVDQISFLTMRRRKLTTAFAFDPHFKIAGFHLFEV
jgi:predicted nucleic acid-binding protein